MSRLRVAVFASGSGSNLQALIDGFNRNEDDQIAARIVQVVSDRADAGALARARAAGIAAAVVPVSGRSADSVTRDTLELLERNRIDLIALAGYLRLLPAALVQRYPDRILNIHPALLPAFGGEGMYGLHVQRAVLASGCTVSGATVHYVTENYDEGHIVAQWPVPVLRNDTPESLAARVLRVEHLLYPAAVELVARSLAGELRVPRLGGDYSFMPAPQIAPDAAALRGALGID